MSIVFLILKIIGIVLLAVAGLLALASVAACFIPIRYRVMVELQEGIYVKIKISWFLHMISYVAEWKENNLCHYLKILGRVKKPKEGSQKEKSQKEKSQKEYSQREEKDMASQKKKAKRKDTKKSDKKKVLKKPEESRGIPEKQKAGRESEKPLAGEGSGKRGGTMPAADKVHGPEGQADQKKSKINDFFRMVKQKLEMLKETINNIHGSVQKILKELASPINHGTLRAALKELVFLLRHMAPKKINGEISFAMGDPCTTGQVLGAICAFPFLYGFQFQIHPDFDSESRYAKGTADIRGHVRGIHLLISAIRLLKDENVHSFMENW